MQRSGHDLIEILSWHLSEQTEENDIKPQPEYPMSFNKIQTRHLLNTSLEHYGYAPSGYKS
jgi:hypothetical protein